MKKILCMVMLVTALFCNVTAFADTAYEDTGEHWAEYVIDRWSGLGIINGYEGNFLPDNYITRGEFATIINRIFKYGEQAHNIFDDLDENFYTEHILCLNKQGIMMGFGKNIRPNDYITREEAGTLLFKALELEKQNKLNADLDDDDKISDWARPYITALVNEGYLNGSDNLLKPLDNITRAETVKLLDNAVIVADEDFYSAAMVEKICIFNQNNIVEGCTFTKPVIVTENVDSLSMKNVKIKSSLFVKSENQNVVKLDNCKVDNIVYADGLSVKKADTEVKKQEIKTDNTQKTDIKTDEIEVVKEENELIVGNSGGYFGSSSGGGSSGNKNDSKNDDEQKEGLGDNKNTEEEKNPDDSFPADDLFMDNDSENPTYDNSSVNGDEIELTVNLEDGIVQRKSKRIVEVIARDKDGAKIDTFLKCNGIEILSADDDDEKTSYTLEFSEEGEYLVEISACDGDGNKKTFAYSVFYDKAEHGDVIGTAVVSIEAFTVGRGYIVAPMMVNVREDVSCAYLVDELLTQMNFDYMNTGSFDGGFYLSSIKDLSDFTPTISDSFAAILESGGYIIDKSMYTPKQLSEFDFTQGSGWMYSVNGEFPNMGFSECYLEDGDVLRIQFSLAYGTDIGGSNNAAYSGMENLFEIVDRTELTKLIENLGIENCSEYLDIITKPDLTAEELSALLETLEGRL